LHKEGVKVQRARVFSEAKIDLLLAHLAERLSEASGLEKCTLLMDQAAVLYLWESLARGKECDQLSHGQLEATELAAYSGWSKTVRQEPSARIPLADPVGSVRLTFIEAAAALTKGLEEFGDPIGENGYLFRSQNRGRTGFNPGPISVDSLRKRIQKRLQDAGIFEGETLHSFCRSAVQHAAINLKYNVKQLMDLGRWKSYSAFKCYVEEIWQKRRI
jgi:hypothetical protein